jgi:hypothetical protein
MNAAHVIVTLTSLAGLLSGCSERAATPLAATVCELTRYPQRMVQIDAEVRVDTDGRTVIGDARCASTKIELRLTEAAERAGAALQLMTAARNAASSGQPSIAVKLTGVFTNTATSTYFVAENIAGLPASR